MKIGSKSNARSIYKSGLLATAAWITTCIIGALITTYLVSNGFVDMSEISYGVVLTLLLATFISTTLVIRLININSLVSTAISGGGTLLLLVLLNLLFSNDGIKNFWVTALVVFAGALASFLVQLKPKKRASYKLKKF